MTRLRWGDEVPADVDAARQRLLDAAETCIDRFGLAKTTVEDIATEAKVSRATIYRYFDNRDELVLAVVLRSLDRSADGDLDDYFTAAETPERVRRGRWSTPWSQLLERLRHDPKLERAAEPGERRRVGHHQRGQPGAVRHRHRRLATPA